MTSRERGASFPRRELCTRRAPSRIHTWWITAGFLLAILSVPNAWAAPSDPNGPKVAYSFVFMGCNRVLKSDVTPDNPSTANLAQLERSFSEIAALDPRPDFVVFTGDLVMGLTTDLSVLAGQLQSWVAVYQASGLGQDPSIRLIALPGNHESLTGSKGTQTSNPGAEDVWLSVMAPYIAGDNGPPAGGADNLLTDQSQLTYSFRFRDSHFVILNTDPFGAVGTVPLHWLNEDLVAAHRNPHIRHIFVLGHKQAFTPPGISSEQALDSNPAMRDQFWHEMIDAGVGYYLVAHAHDWDFSQPIAPTFPDEQHTVQIIAGNGGTAPDPGWSAPYFGFTQVVVLKNKEVRIRSYGRDFDRTNYLAPSPPDLYPTTIRMSLDFARGQ